VLRAARQIARTAHADQTDKAGAPYIGHPARVAALAVASATSPADMELLAATAWLHDVLEDTAVTSADLRAYGIPETVIAAVTALTRRPAEADDTYYVRVAADSLALRVKLADIADNTSPERLGQLDAATRSWLEAKYGHALATLERLAVTTVT